MSFDCAWRLNRRTFDMAELRETVEAVAREYEGVRVEWAEGNASHLPCYLWLPAKLVKARQGFLERMDGTPVNEEDGPLPTELAFSFDDAGPEPFVLTQYPPEENETIFDARFVAPSLGSTGLAVGSAIFRLSQRRWEIEHTDEEYWFRAMHVTDGGQEVWAGSEHGVVSRRARNGEWTSFPSVGGQIDMIHVVSPTRIYLGMESGDLLEFDGTRVLRQSPEMFDVKLVNAPTGSTCSATRSSTGWRETSGSRSTSANGSRSSRWPPMISASSGWPMATGCT